MTSFQDSSNDRTYYIIKMHEGKEKEILSNQLFCFIYWKMIRSYGKGENGLRLGVVMTGNGAHAAACAGVLHALCARGIEPCAVAGVQGGALAAALYLSGQEPAQMLNAIAAAADLGKKLLPMQRPAQRAIRGGEPAFFRSGKLERMLEEHTGRRLLAVSPRTGVFLCRFVRTGRHVIFSTRAYPQEGGAMLNMQTSIGFAARAASALPPFLSPVSWMGSPLLPETDLDFACRQLFLLGAQRALIIRPVLSVHTPPDVVDLTSMALAYGMDRMPQKGCTAVLNIPMPDGVGALSFQKMPACVRAGKETAEQQLDQLLEQMGMAYGRILPFKGQRR